MIDYIKQLLSEKGSASIMRFAFIQLISTGIIIAFLQVLASFVNAYLVYKGYKPINNDYFSIISLMFSTAGVLKIGQKIAEVKSNKKGAGGE